MGSSRPAISFAALFAALVLACALVTLGAPLASGPGAGAGAALPAGSVSCSTTAPITYGSSTTSGSIASAGARACFTFSAAAGDTVFLTMAPTSGDLRLFYDFFGSDGVSQCASPFDGATYCSVGSSEAGTWTLQVSDSAGTGTGTFRLSVQRLNAGVGCTALKFGRDATSKIKKASSSCFTFTSAAGDDLYVQSTATSGTLGSASAFVMSSNGTLECDTNGTVECALTVPGPQTLLFFSGGGSGKGKFTFYPQQMTAPKHCTALTAGGPTESGSVAAQGDVACFTFAGKSGDTYTATLSALTGTLAPEIDFFDPSGTSTCATPATSLSCGVTTTGSWTILVYDSRSTGTGGFSIALTKT